MDGELSSRVKCNGCGAESYNDCKTKLYCPKCYTDLQAENKRLKDILFKYTKTMRKIASKIWDTKTSVSMHQMLGEMEKDITQALKESTK